MYEKLYAEFGEMQTHIVRRELTARNKKPPSYIELLAELCLKQGSQPNDGVQPTADGAAAEPRALGYSREELKNENDPGGISS